MKLHPIPSHPIRSGHFIDYIYSHVNLKYLPSGYAAVFVPLMNTWSLARTSASVSWKYRRIKREKHVEKMSMLSDHFHITVIKNTRTSMSH
jgi:hypothetical protein